MSLGDSLAAGYKAQPATKVTPINFTWMKYLESIPNTLFDNAAVPGATSSDVLHFQIPQVHLFEPTVVTMSVGGNDLLSLLALPNPTQGAPAVLQDFAANLSAILAHLCYSMPPRGQIYLQTYIRFPRSPVPTVSCRFQSDLCFRWYGV
jgi:lysophospholipase L1-like esterase